MSSITTDAEYCGETLEDDLDAIKNAFPAGYTRFIRRVRPTVYQCVQKQGHPRALAVVDAVIRPYNMRGVLHMPDFNVQKSLFKIMGYQPDKGDIKVVWMENFEDNRSSLEEFVNVTGRHLLLVESDPVGETLPSAEADIPTLVAHFSYHFFMRLELLTIHPPPDDKLPSRSWTILHSIEAVEMCTEKLGVMLKGSEAYQMWEKYKEFMVRRAHINADVLLSPVPSYYITLSKLLRFVVKEMEKMVSTPLYNLWQHCQNVASLIGQIFWGEQEMLDASYCLDKSYAIQGAFTEEYLTHNRNVQTFLVACCRKRWTKRMKSCAYDSLKWQAKHFLSCFRPEHFQEYKKQPIERDWLSKQKVVKTIWNSKQGRTETRSIAEMLREKFPEELDHMRQEMKSLPKVTSDILNTYFNEMSNYEKLRNVCDRMLRDAYRHVDELRKELDDLRDCLTDCSLPIVFTTLSDACDKKEDELQIATAYSGKLISILSAVYQAQPALEKESGTVNDSALNEWLCSILSRCRGDAGLLEGLLAGAADHLTVRCQHVFLDSYQML